MNIYSSSQTISKFVRQLSRYEPSSPSTTWYNKSEVDGGAIRSHFISFIFITGHPQSSIHCISEICPFEGDINVIITDQNFFASAPTDMVIDGTKTSKQCDQIWRLFELWASL